MNQYTCKYVSTFIIETRGSWNSTSYIFDAPGIFYSIFFHVIKHIATHKLIHYYSPLMDNYPLKIMLVLRNDTVKYSDFNKIPVDVIGKYLGKVKRKWAKDISKETFPKIISVLYILIAIIKYYTTQKNT